MLNSLPSERSPLGPFPCNCHVSSGFSGGPGCKDFGQGALPSVQHSLSGLWRGAAASVTTCCSRVCSLSRVSSFRPSPLELAAPSHFRSRAPTPLCWTWHCLQLLAWVLGVPRHRGLEEAVIYVGLGLALFRGWGGWAGMLAGAVLLGAGSGLVGQQCLCHGQGWWCCLLAGPPWLFPVLLVLPCIFVISPLLSGE